MNLSPLTPQQQQAADSLVATRRLRSVPTDGKRAATFLALADERLAELSAIGSAIVRSGIAYDAARDVGEAFLAAYGYATVNGAGQHAAVGEFLIAILDAPPRHAQAAQAFDQFRRARNNQNYRASSVGSEQSTRFEALARTLRETASARGVGT